VAAAGKVFNVTDRTLPQAGTMGGRPKSADESADVVQVRDDTRTEPFDLVGRGQEIGNHDRHHAGGRCGAHTIVGILQGTTPNRSAAFRNGSGAGLWRA